MDKYASHQQLLVAAALQTTGPIAEMGCGDYSTPLLAEIAAHMGRTFEVWTTDRKWGSRFERLCPVNHLGSWDDYPYREAGLTFLDNEQYVRDRKLMVPRLLETSKVVVCHDFGADEWNCRHATTLAGDPPSVALSNHFPVKLLMMRGSSAVAATPPGRDTTVCCVYRTGGDYTAEYVHRLYRGVAANTTVPFNFRVLTDSDEDLPGTVVPLTDDLPGWWSKLELFRTHLGRTVYFDLDTVIAGNIDPIMLYDGPMAMLQDFCNDEWASGVMAFNGPVRQIYDYAMSIADHIRSHPGEWDQRLISKVLKDNRWHVDIIQQAVIKVHSFKLHCREGIPEDARIIAFHGRPRPHEVGWLDPGVKWSA